ncbi:hypothetical protein BGZ54_006645 [Gamsiella multidivaricata]|nr:hypothetical protein BGZ54_006645 [Gamsiella multidivaricata]
MRSIQAESLLMSEPYFSTSQRKSMATSTDDVIADEPGKFISVRSQPHEPIFMLLERIVQALQEDDPTTYQRSLAINGIPLNDLEQPLFEYIIHGGGLAYHSLKKGTQLRINVKTLTGKTLEFNVNYRYSIMWITIMIQKKEGIPPKY